MAIMWKMYITGYKPWWGGGGGEFHNQTRRSGQIDPCCFPLVNMKASPHPKYVHIGRIIIVLVIKGTYYVYLLSQYCIVDLTELQAHKSSPWFEHSVSFC